MATATKPRRRDYYTVADAARLLDVSPSTIWRWIKAGRLPAARVGPRTIRIRQEDLDALIRPAASPPPVAIPRVLSLDEARQMVGRRPQLSEEELARRRAWFEEVVANRIKRDIRPLTSADLVHRAREWMTDPDAPSRW